MNAIVDFSPRTKAIHVVRLLSKESDNTFATNTFATKSVVGQNLRLREGSILGLLVVAFLIVGCVASLFYLYIENDSSRYSSTQPIESVPLPKAGQVARPTFPVTVRKPSGPPVVDLGVKDEHGNAVTVSCSTCHSTRQPNFENRAVADLNEFHGSLNFSHGTVSCLSCHNSVDYDALKLADGSRVEFVDVMTLCAQCHGPQMKDYEHGVHGGFNGYWDLKRGAQTKNNCVDCHNPHAPQFPKMQPTFKPRDRFLEKQE